MVSRRGILQGEGANLFAERRRHNVYNMMLFIPAVMQHAAGSKVVLAFGEAVQAAPLTESHSCTSSVWLEEVKTSKERFWKMPEFPSAVHNSNSFIGF